VEQYFQEGTLKSTVNPKNKLSIIHIIVSKQGNNPDTTNSSRKKSKSTGDGIG
jgi:hypothetical protein